MERDLVNVFDQLMVMKEEKKDINSLPNEMLRTVLAKLKVPKLIDIRAVSRRWQAVAESICHEKHSLVIVARDARFNARYLSDRFNGLVDFGNRSCAELEAKTNPSASDYTISLSRDLCNFLARLFPRVENLAFYSRFDSSWQTLDSLFTLLGHWSSTIVTLLLPDHLSIPAPHLVAQQIVQLSGLKRLSITSASLVNATTLARLEHCSFTAFGFYTVKILPNLTALCTSLYWDGLMALNGINNWHNAPLVNGLTHLSFRLLEHDHFEVLSFVCEHFASLQMLNVRFMFAATFNAQLIAPFARRNSLSQLSIERFRMDLVALARSSSSSNLQRNSIRILTLSDVNCHTDYHFDGDRFCRVLSAFFPRLEQLTLVMGRWMVRDVISPHLHHFANLLKLEITAPY